MRSSDAGHTINIGVKLNIDDTSLDAIKRYLDGVLKDFKSNLLKTPAEVSKPKTLEPGQEVADIKLPLATSALREVKDRLAEESITAGINYTGAMKELTEANSRAQELIYNDLYDRIQKIGTSKGEPSVAYKRLSARLDKLVTVANKPVNDAGSIIKNAEVTLALLTRSIAEKVSIIKGLITTGYSRSSKRFQEVDAQIRDMVTAYGDIAGYGPRTVGGRDIPGLFPRIIQMLGEPQGAIGRLYTGYANATGSTGAASSSAQLHSYLRELQKLLPHLEILAKRRILELLFALTESLQAVRIAEQDVVRATQNLMPFTRRLSGGNAERFWCIKVSARICGPRRTV